MSFSKLQLINYIYDQGASPSSPPGKFIQLCRTWLDIKFPDKNGEEKDRFANTFHSTVARKYAKAKNKTNLLNTATNKAFFAQPIFPPEDVAPPPPKQPKLDDSGLGDANGGLFAESETQTDAAGPECFLKLCKDYFQNQGEEAL